MIEEAGGMKLDPKELPTIVVSSGDPAGVGPEVVV